jgi:hypothetical protein
MIQQNIIQLNDEISYSSLFSICTLVTRKNEYEEMLETFYTKGFTNENSEFLYIDNSETNKADGYSGLNQFLAQSKGKYTIVCHQDIRLEFDNIYKLQECIKEIDKLDPNWSILGNAGVSCDFFTKHIRITDPHGSDQRTSEFPAKVDSLDENFLVIKNGLNIGLSRDLSGFHFYGTDLCLQSSLRGYSAYVINFHLRHLSPGNVDNYFYSCKKDLIKKYEYALRSRFIQTTCTYMYISSFTTLNTLFNNKLFFKFKKIFDGYKNNK